MLGRTGTAYAKKTNKFEDSDSHMSRPRAVFELPHRPAPRVPLRARTAVAAAAAVGSEASGAHHRALGVGRGTSPRSPLHEKKAAGASDGVGAGSGVAELEAKLGKAQDQLTDMREQLAAAEKARKDARAALVEAKKRFGAEKKRDAATSAPVDDGANVPAEQKQKTEVVTARVTNGGIGERRSIGSPATDVLEPVVPNESENKRAQDKAKKTTHDDDEEVNSIANIADGDGKKGNPEVDQLSSKLMAKDAEVNLVRAKLMVKDKEVDELRVKLTAKDTEVDELTEKLMAKDAKVNLVREKLMVKDKEVDELRVKLTAKDTEVDELTEKLMAKDAEVAALQADNADLMKMAEESSEAVKDTAAKAREIEHALRESAAREARVAERLRASERAREALEAEMQRSRVQSEQWRKAAEEAAVVLGDVDHHAGARGAETDKDKRRHSSAGGTGESSGGKRKSGATGGAMRMLSDLWKKKGQK